MQQRIGKVTHYYNRLGVAVLELDDDLNVGDHIYLSGYTTDFDQRVASMEIEHKKVQTAGPGMDVAMKVAKRVRAGDVVYKVIETSDA